MCLRLRDTSLSISAGSEFQGRGSKPTRSCGGDAAPLTLSETLLLTCREPIGSSLSTKRGSIVVDGVESAAYTPSLRVVCTGHWCQEVDSFSCLCERRLLAAIDRLRGERVRVGELADTVNDGQTLLALTECVSKGPWVFSLQGYVGEYPSFPAVLLKFLKHYFGSSSS